MSYDSLLCHEGIAAANSLIQSLNNSAVFGLNNKMPSVESSNHERISKDLTTLLAVLALLDESNGLRMGYQEASSLSERVAAVVRNVQLASFKTQGE